MVTPENINVLMVEQDPMDAIIIRKELEKERKLCCIHNVRDGVAAIDYLRNKECQNGNSLPDLIVLAENLPVLNGSQLLQLLNADANLRKIPLILIQRNRDNVVAAEKYRLLAGQSLATTPNKELLSPFIHIINNYFKKKT